MTLLRKHYELTNKNLSYFLTNQSKTKTFIDLKVTRKPKPTKNSTQPYFNEIPVHFTHEVKTKGYDVIGVNLFHFKLIRFHCKKRPVPPSPLTFPFFSATSHKGSRVHGKVNKGRMTETGRNGEKMKRLHVVYPARHRRVHHGSVIGRKLIPFGFRIQRYKISLIPFKRKLKRPREFQNFKNALKKSFKLSLKNSLKKPVQTTFKKSIRKLIKKSRKIGGLKRH